VAFFCSFGSASLYIVCAGIRDMDMDMDMHASCGECRALGQLPAFLVCHLFGRDNLFRISDFFVGTKNALRCQVLSSLFARSPAGSSTTTKHDHAMR